MVAGVDSLANADDVVEALDDVQDERESQRQELEDLDETRRQLETAPEPDHALDTDTKPEPDGTDGYEMTQTRRVGSVSVPVDGEGTVRFGKPSGRAGMEMLNNFDELEKDGATLFDQAEYGWATLEEWALDDEHDAEWWSNSIGAMDTIVVCRSVALGGNGQTR